MSPEALALRALLVAGFLLVLVPVALLLFPSGEVTGSLALRHCYASQRGAALPQPAPCRGAWLRVGTPPRDFCPAHGFVDRPPGLGPAGNAWMDQPGDGRPVILPSPREQLAAAGVTDPATLGRASARRLPVLPLAPAGPGWVSPEARGLALYPLGFLLALAGLRLLGRAVTAAAGGDRPPPATMEEAIERHAPELGGEPPRDPTADLLVARGRERSPPP